MQDLEAVRTKWLEAAAAASSPAALEEVRVKALGKSGEISALMKGLGAMAPDERRAAGAALNAVKDAVAVAIEARKTALQDSELDERLKTERVDVTLPPRPEPDGRLHPISQTVDEIVAIFGAMGFCVAEGPDIEDDFHNFTALNIPPEHPARQMHDTFYIAGADGTGGPNDQLAGGHGTIASATPIRTIGSYWPYATTVFDYVRRAMPLTQPQSLTNDETYALAAYLLHINGIISEDEVMDASTLPRVEMPNRTNFVPAL